MALFGTTRAFLGLDIGTSSLKMVELIDRKKRLELTAYAQADLPNLLLDDITDEATALKKTADVVSAVMEKAATSADSVIAALPSSVVFSTVLTLPDMPEDEMDKAVHFAARDVVPANLSEMTLGWSRLGQAPHMDMAPLRSSSSEGQASAAPKTPGTILSASSSTVPVFVTAAPKKIVERYSQLAVMLKVQLYALEVETLPLARSLLKESTQPTLLVDFGDHATTFHIIDGGAPRVSLVIEYGGADLTAALVAKLGISQAEADEQKYQYGVLSNAPPQVRTIISEALQKIIQEGRRVIATYAEQSKTTIQKTILIGGGANLPGLESVWGGAVTSAMVGNPWRGLTFLQELEGRLPELGPQYAVAVGLALRGFQ